MKTTGIVRKLDTLGRVVVPMEMRRKLRLKTDSPIEIIMEGDRILMRKYNIACIFCEATEDLVEFRNKHICRQCLCNIVEEDQMDRGSLKRSAEGA